MYRGGTRRANAITYRIVGAAMLVLAVFLAWKTHWFHAEASLSSYPQFDLTYATAKYEVITHSRGGTTRQLVLIAANGTRYVMEDGVWHAHFDGPALERMLAGGGAVHVWVHPEYPRALRGITGGKVDIPPSWGFDYDHRNMAAGVFVDGFLALLGGGLILFSRRTT